MLSEVSNEINPGVWLKVLREEFEVKISNEDGSPWCPLYMGFGYGMSWYEAKSVELPIKLQWELVEKYGDKGFSNWNGKGREFCDTIPDMLRDFEVRDSRNQILDKDNQGKEIKPTLNNQVLGMCKDDSAIYGDAVKEYIKTHDGSVDYEANAQGYLSSHYDDICKFLDANYHIQCLYQDEDGNYVLDFKPAKDTQTALNQYCKLHGVDRSQVDLKDIEEYSGSAGVANAPTIISDLEDDEDNLQRVKDARIDSLGLYMDIEKKEVTLLYIPQPYLKFIQDRVNRDGNGYRVYFKDSYGLCDANNKGGLYMTNSYLTSEAIQIIQELYFKFFNDVEKTKK